MAKSLYVKRGERVLGPTALADLRRHAASGRLRTSDLVGESGNGPWRPAAEIDVLAEVLASSRNDVDDMIIEDISERNEMYEGLQSRHEAPVESSVYRPSESSSHNTVLLWSLLGGGLLLLVAGGVAVVLLGGGGVDKSDGQSLQPLVLSDKPEHCERALRLDAAARVLDRANAWIADAAEEDDGDLDGRRRELKTIATEFGDSAAIGVECLRIDDLFDRYGKVRVELENARQAFVDLEPANPRYLEPGKVADAARRIGVARLTRSADKFIEVLQLARDERAALGRLVSMSQAEFDRATLVMPLKSTAPRSRLLALARFHSNFRAAERAGGERKRLAGERMAQTVARNRKATTGMPVVLQSVAETAAAVTGIAARNGSRVILVWNSASDCFWTVAADAPEGLAQSLQAASLTIWPQSERSLKIRVVGTMLGQLAEWLAQQRQVARSLSDGKPQGERPLYFLSKRAKNRFLSTGHWGHEPELILAGELGLESIAGDSRAVLTVDSIVVGVAPTVATLPHNRKHWGLVGRVIRADASFPVTLHRPRTIRMIAGKTGPTFNPYSEIGAEKAGGGEAGYLRSLVSGDEAEITALNDGVTAHMQQEIKKTQAIVPAVTLPQLEQGLIQLVGEKQAKVDARTIGGAGLRAVLGAHRLSATSDRLYPNGALFAYNITIVRTTVSPKGRAFFDSEIRDRVLEFVIARDGIWLLSSRELCEVVETVLPRAGFYTKGGRKPLVPTARDPDVAVFDPSVPVPPVDPKAPASPVVIVEPADVDGQAACRQHAAEQSVAHQRILREHEQNITNGVYKADADWRKYQQAMVEWKQTKATAEEKLLLRKTRLGESVRLREGLQATWNQIAQGAFDAVRQRAGRPEKSADEEKAVVKDMTLLPSIREALDYRLTGGGQ